MKDAPLNLAEYLIRDSKAASDYKNPVWPKGIGPWFWGEPLFGYYLNTDSWLLRKHAEMLADAGVDVIVFDCTNNNITYEESYWKLLEEFAKTRKDGVRTPQIAFMIPFFNTDGGKEILREIYHNLYKPGRYQELWFLWRGKPLIMGAPELAEAPQRFLEKPVFKAPFWERESGRSGVQPMCNTVPNYRLRQYRYDCDFPSTAGFDCVRDRSGTGEVHPVSERREQDPEGSDSWRHPHSPG